MAKISTRQTPDEMQAVYDRLYDVILNGTSGAVSKSPTAVLVAGQTIHELIDTLENVFIALNDVGRRMMLDLEIMSHEHIVNSVKLEEVLDVLESLTDISYDDALDHATSDLMDAFMGAGVAEATAGGELQFDSAVVMGRGDLKPILREAIIRWVDLKIQP